MSPVEIVDEQISSIVQRIVAGVPPSEWVVVSIVGIGANELARRLKALDDETNAYALGVEVDGVDVRVSWSSR